MNVMRAVFCSSPREGIVAFSVLTAQLLVRPFRRKGFMLVVIANMELFLERLRSGLQSGCVE